MQLKHPGVVQVVEPLEETSNQVWESVRAQGLGFRDSAVHGPGR